MGLFKKKIVKEIDGAIWATCSTFTGWTCKLCPLKCVLSSEKGFLEGGKPVTFIRVFKPEEAQMKNITITGWETFDQYPDLIHFEGYLTKRNEAFLDPKKGGKA